MWTIFVVGIIIYIYTHTYISIRERSFNDISFMFLEEFTCRRGDTFRKSYAASTRTLSSGIKIRACIHMRRKQCTM